MMYTNYKQTQHYSEHDRRITTSLKLAALSCIALYRQTCYVSAKVCRPKHALYMEHAYTFLVN